MKKKAWRAGLYSFFIGIVYAASFKIPAVYDFYAGLFGLGGESSGTSEILPYLPLAAAGVLIPLLTPPRGSQGWGLALVAGIAGAFLGFWVTAALSLILF